MVSIVFIIFVTVHMSCSFSDPMALPRGLAVFLEKMEIPRDEFMRRYQAYKAGASPISVIRHDASTSSQTSSDVPEHSGGVNTTELNNLPVIPEDATCKPRPAIIELPRVFGTSLYPSFVILYRCGGSCSLQDAQHCAVTAQDAINVEVLEIIYKQWDFKSMKLYSHTQCSCDCIQTASDCDPQIQIWNADHCKCNCIEDGSQCDGATQSWDIKTCACKCDTAPQICAHNKEWDAENCGCHCKKILQDKCKANNQNIDINTCQCLDVNVL
ncbi:vascular endothelial growth factor C-like isoform X2 [Orbicella faveolata]|uniref:vascular endothelial growth factor C-like isoform X2 n=1 Tax=Orbicella faveolata TaxID=48498 RepID=UPI0009E30DB9|nr:vascular endothelial growth factor C-like isoform X2 [Orbicella faveolata]